MEIWCVNACNLPASADDNKEESSELQVVKKQTLWKNLSKVFAKNKANKKASTKYDIAKEIYFKDVKLLERPTSIRQSEKGYKVAFAERPFQVAKQEQLELFVKLPDGITSKDIAVTLELIVLKSSSLERSQKSNVFYCVKETDSQTVFAGSIKIKNKTNFFRVLPIPVHLIDSEQNIIVDSEGLNHDTIIKMSHDALLAKRSKKGNVDDVRIKIIFNRVRNSKTCGNKNYKGIELGKLEESLMKDEDGGDIESFSLGEITEGLKKRSENSVTESNDLHSEGSEKDSINDGMFKKRYDFPQCYSRKCSLSADRLFLYENPEPSTSYYRESASCDMSTQHISEGISSTSTQHSCTHNAEVRDTYTQSSSPYFMKDVVVNVQASLCDVHLKPDEILSGFDLTKKPDFPHEDLAKKLTSLPPSLTTSNSYESSSAASETSLLTNENFNWLGFATNKPDAGKPLENHIQQKSWSPITTLAIRPLPKLPKEYPSFPTEPSGIDHLKGKAENLLSEEMCFLDTLVNTNNKTGSAKPNNQIQNSDKLCEIVQSVEVHISSNPFRYEDIYKSYYEDDDCYYEKHRENIKKYFENKRTAPTTEQTNVYLSGDNTQNEYAKLEELNACFGKMGDILATTSLDYNNCANVSGTVREKDYSTDQLAKERLETYEKAENGIQKIIKELLKESEDIKESVLLQGAKEECDPPVILDYINTKTNYEELCLVMMDEIDKYRTNIRNDVLSIIDDIIAKIIEKADYFNNLEGTHKIIPPTYFANSTFVASKIPKTSYCFGKLCNSCTNISPTSSFLSNATKIVIENACDDCSNSNTKNEQMKHELEDDLNENKDVEDNTILNEEIFQRSISLNSITNLGVAEECSQVAFSTDQITYKETDEEHLIQNIDLISESEDKKPNTSPRKPKHQAECSFSSEEEIFSTLCTISEVPKDDEPQPSTSSANKLCLKTYTPLDSKSIALQQKPATHNIRQAIQEETTRNPLGSAINFKILESCGAESSDVDDEKESITTSLNLPKFRYKSKQELNSPQEIAAIEKNLQENDICVRKNQ